MRNKLVNSWSTAGQLADRVLLQRHEALRTLLGPTWPNLAQLAQHTSMVEDSLFFGVLSDDFLHNYGGAHEPIAVQGSLYAVNLALRNVQQVRTRLWAERPPAIDPSGRGAGHRAGRPPYRYIDIRRGAGHRALMEAEPPRPGREKHVTTQLVLRWFTCYAAPDSLRVATAG